MRTRPLTFLLFLLLIAGAGCGRKGDDGDKPANTDSASQAKDGESKSVKKEEGKKKDGKEDGETEKEPEAVPVEVAEAHVGDISSYLLFNSTLETEGAVEYPRPLPARMPRGVDRGEEPHPAAVEGSAGVRQAPLCFLAERDQRGEQTVSTCRSQLPMSASTSRERS